MATIQSLAQIPSRAMQLVGEVFARVDAAHQPTLFDRAIVILQGRAGLADHIFGSGPHTFARLFYVVADGKGEAVPSSELKRLALCALVPHVEELAQVAGFSNRLAEFKAIDWASHDSSARANPVPWWFASKYPLQGQQGVVPIQEGHLGVGAGAIALARLNDMRAQVEDGKIADTIPDGFGLEPYLVAVPHGLYDTVLINLFGRSPTKKGLEGIDINSPGRLKVKALLPPLGPNDFLVIDKEMVNGPVLREWCEKRTAGTITREDELRVIEFVRKKYQTVRGVQEVQKESDDHDNVRIVLILKDKEGKMEKRVLKATERLFPPPDGPRKETLTDRAFRSFQHQIMGVPVRALPDVLSRTALEKKPPQVILSFDQKGILPGGDILPDWVGERLQQYSRGDIRRHFVEGLNFAVMSFHGEQRHLEIASEDPISALLLGMAMAGRRISSRFMTVAISPHTRTGAVGSAGKNIWSLGSGVRLARFLGEARERGLDVDWVRAGHGGYVKERVSGLKGMAAVYGIAPSHPFSTAVLDDYYGTMGSTEGMVRYERLQELYATIFAETNPVRQCELLRELTEQVRSRNVSLGLLLEVSRQLAKRDRTVQIADLRKVKEMTVEGVGGLVNFVTYAERHHATISPDILSLYQYLWELGEITEPPPGVISQLTQIVSGVVVNGLPSDGVPLRYLKSLARRVPPCFSETRRRLKGDRLSLSSDTNSGLDAIDRALTGMQRLVGWVRPEVEKVELPPGTDELFQEVLCIMIDLNKRFTPHLDHQALVGQLAATSQEIEDRLLRVLTSNG